MPDNGKITPHQLMVLVVLTILPTAVLFLPAISATSAKGNSWISAILAMLSGLGISSLVMALSLRFPDKPLDLYSEEIIGNFGRRCIGILYFWFFLHGGSIVVREYAEYLNSSVLPRTPSEVLVFSTLLLSGFAVRCGLEVIGRAGEFILPIIVAMVLFVLLFSYNDIRWEHLLPMMADGVSPVAQGAFAPISWFGEVVAIAFFLPHVNQGQAQECKNAVRAGISLIGILLVAVAIWTIGVFGASEVAMMRYPTFELARVISIGEFLERVEWIINSLWILGAFMKITIFYYIAILIAARLFRLKDYKPLVFPGGLLMMILSIWSFDNVVELVDFLGKAWPSYSLILFEAGIPLCLFMAALIRGTGRKPG